MFNRKSEYLFIVRHFHLFQVSDEKIGQMRLKFWHDAINKVYEKDKSKKLPEHPVIYEVNNVRFTKCSTKTWIYF